MTLGGVVMVFNAIRYDYCLTESVECLRELCDEVVILDAGSNDGTHELVKSLQDKKTKAILLDEGTWEQFQGKERLATLQNMALGFLETDYYYLQQADEVTHEESFPFIRQAIETGKEAFYITRLNLWKDANHVLDVPHERKPCSTQIVRLAKTNCFSYGDGESIASDFASIEFIYKIKMWHYGFIRKKEVMKAKIVNMQESVFNIPHDSRLDNSDSFRWDDFFSEEDLVKITEPHPKFIHSWVKTRP